MLNGLDLFSGIGGISLALREWVRPTAYCEIDPHCQGVLLSRMADEILYTAPIWGNISTLQSSYFGGIIDIIYGGFPCQDISVAGLGKGLAGERSGLFFEIVRLSKEIKPKFIFLENVPAITSRGGLQVVREITEMGYDCRWCVISAASVGALHRRERWFLLAHASSKSPNGYTERKEKKISMFRNDGNNGNSYSIASDGFTNVADAKSEQNRGIQLRKISSDSASVGFDGNSYSIASKQTDPQTKSFTDGRESRRGSSGEYWPFESREHWQETVSTMGKCSDGISNHAHRLKSLGNAVVPIQAKEAFKILMGIK